MEGVKGSDIYTHDQVDSRVVLSTLLVRGCNQIRIENKFNKVLKDGHLIDAILIAFMTRNIRGGKGERDLFFYMYLTLFNSNKDLASFLLELIPHYGSWRDIFDLLKYQPLFKDSIIDLVKKQFEKDEKNMAEGKPVSLLAKWIPRERNQYGKEFAYALSTKSPVQARYPDSRKRISSLNKYLNTTEIAMCGNTWDKIVPSSVPGRCMKLHTKAFLNLKLEGNELRKPDDEIRKKCRENFQEYYASTASHKLLAKGSDTLYPHEIVNKVEESFSSSSTNQDERNMLIGVWDAFVRKAKEQGGLGRSIAMCDFSGSMNGLPLEVSRALGLLISEVTIDAFKNTLLTFDSNPKLVKIPEYCDIFQKVQWLKENSNYGQGLSTDFQKAMELILENLLKERVPVGEEPENLIVLTDMGFDAACGSNQQSSYTGNSYKYNVKTQPWQTHIEMIRENFKTLGETMWGEGKGYKVPRIVIWNLSNHCQDIHSKSSEEGVVMLSGWSPTLFKVLMAKGVEIQTPLTALRYLLDDPMYDLVREKISLYLKDGNLLKE
jgi:hypothetical protein